MTLTHMREARHRRVHAVTMVARAGQFTGALPNPGGVAAPGPGHRAGAWAGRTVLPRHSWVLPRHSWGRRRP